MSDLTKDDFMCQFPNWEHYEEQREPNEALQTAYQKQQAEKLDQLHAALRAALRALSKARGSG